MTVHDLLEYGEYVLREDKEYWEEMDRIKGEIDKLLYRQRMIIAATIIRLAAAMIVEKHGDSKCADCTPADIAKRSVAFPYVSPCVDCNGKVCEICTEGKDDDEE